MNEREGSALIIVGCIMILLALFTPAYTLWGTLWLVVLVPIGAGLVIEGYRARKRAIAAREIPAKPSPPPSMLPTMDRPNRRTEVEEVVRREEITRTQIIVKVRCHYCSALYDETLEKCPHCGGKV
jgi:hypothetical protein